MGEVYRARDSKLGREVAIKVLPQGFVRNPERLARFEREARLLASLDHPNIGAVYESLKEKGIHFIVMQLVEGETLRERIARGQVPLKEALAVFLQIAKGLESAHGHGVVHRDLKPDNIKVTEDGKVKILDFGIAKAMDASPTTSPYEKTIEETPPTPDLKTIEGVLIGTPAYMSPEQARGKPLDKRTDIWSFGCCLYEALTGVMPFKGDTGTDTMAKILERDPDWEALPRETPLSIQTLLRRCMEKDPERRLRDIGDARIEIEDTLSNPTDAVSSLEPRLSPSRLILGGLGIFLLGLLAAWATFNGPIVSQKAPEKQVIRFQIEPQSEIDFSDWRKSLALSRDGKRLAYVGLIERSERMIYVQNLATGETKLLPGTEGATHPLFSPDGHSLAYLDFSNSDLEIISIDGGNPRHLCKSNRFIGGVWLEDDTIVFSPDWGEGLMKISATGGTSESLTVLEESEGIHRWPCELPDGKGLLFICNIKKDYGENRELCAISSKGGNRRKILDRCAFAVYLPSKHLIFERDGSLFVTRFDPNSLKLLGKAIPLPVNILRGNAKQDSVQLTFSQTGLLAYLPGKVSEESDLVWVDDRGRAEPVLGAPHRKYSQIDLSPDGEKISMCIEGDIWVFNISRKVPNRITFDGMSKTPSWLNSSNDLIYIRLIEGDKLGYLIHEYLDGSRAEEDLIQFHRRRAEYTGTKDAKFWLWSLSIGMGNSDIWMTNLESDIPENIDFAVDNNYQRCPDLSPDEHWVAYSSDETGVWEVYVRPFPGPGPKTQISISGGQEPHWDPRGGKLYYRNGDEMWAVNYEAGEKFSPGTPQFLFREHFVREPPPSYVPTGDGSFLMMREDNMAPGARINLVVNWFEELKRLMPEEE